MGDLYMSTAHLPVLFVPKVEVFNNQIRPAFDGLVNIFVLLYQILFLAVLCRFFFHWGMSNLWRRGNHILLALKTKDHLSCGNSEAYGIPYGHLHAT